MNCLVIGGTQFIGRMMVAELLKQDHSVSILHRKPKHDLGRRVKNIMADRVSSDSAHHAHGDGGPD